MDSLTATMLVNMCFSSGVDTTQCIVHKINPDYVLIHMCYKIVKIGQPQQYTVSLKEKVVKINLVKCQGPI